MSNYVVNDELTALNNQVTELSAMLRRITQDSDDLYMELQRKHLRYCNMLLERGELKERLRAAEETFQQAKEKAASEQA